MTASRTILILAVTVCAACAWPQSNAREPHIGYLYPGGGRQGNVVQVTVGGQFIRGVNKVHVSGEGVRARVLEYYRPIRNIQKDQREELLERLGEVLDARLAELPEAERAGALAALRSSSLGVMRPQGKAAVNKPKPPAQKVVVDANSDATKKAAAAKAVFRPVEHPLLHDLENKSLKELGHLAYHIFFPRTMKQQNAQIDELALIEITIDPDAAPGDRELRLEMPTGLTNPMVFQVGPFPEVVELEPNDPKAWVNPNVPKDPPIDLPVTLNGQIMPGDVDRFRIRAKKGQQLVMRVHARRLVPYLADAVPGWFQATMALYNDKGDEVAFADDYRFDPDPVLSYKIPADGIYELEIRDSIYRGREDFVYRIAVGEQPFITQAYPLGGREGAETVAAIDGWNLTKKQVPLDTQPGGDRIRRTILRDGPSMSNEVTYAVDSLPDCLETEPNDTIGNAQKIDLPQIVNGRIARPGDVDVFQFKGLAGGEVTAEVYGRRLNSPLDSILRVTDSSGRALQWNDDYDQKDGDLRTGPGLLTHHADSYLMASLPADGIYYVHLADAQRHGGEAFAYRLRISAPRPDFELRLTPSGLSIPAGSLAPVTVYALRKDGFDGEIEIALKDAPAGFELGGGAIPAGRDRVRLTLQAPGKPLGEPVAIRLEGRASIGGHTVTRPVVPAEDMMQAFLWRHLVPSRELLVSVARTRGWAPPIQLAGGGPVRIPAGGTAEVRLTAAKSAALRQIQLELNKPPEGVSLEDVALVPEGLALRLKAEAAQAGFADNLIVEGFREFAPKPQAGKPAGPRRRTSLGVLAAIPVEIVQR